MSEILECGNQQHIVAANVSRNTVIGTNSVASIGTLQIV